MEKTTVLYEKEEQIARISLNRPHNGNTLNVSMHEALYNALLQAHEDESVYVILLQGTNHVFCTGIYAKEKQNNELQMMWVRLITAIASIEKPIVAYMNGKTSGEGISLALACDFRVAEYDTKITLDFLKHQAVPYGGISYYLPRLVGLSKAMELALGETISAEEAYRINLITKIGNPDQLIRLLTSIPIQSFGYTSQNMKEGFENSLEDVLEMEVKSNQ
ncbi:2-(1,2-epoxy-1,2-dihydrophenyl)acetyl-CoA isomerase [Alteribacillus persepolensis]|uniref:2-(1,2-epoxy-1,2-dihydrophenyl)acetyl-CoA isomerase n=1 Tax=Alteribacillus persepolensis TaxID=568899 RepID=A0A1G8G5Y7_9BACI|nr:enoyl-CoA hydratase/isomerase family protein [Alteribacillus persepolensis]SDH89752.1 2-(1,2-epoxy-1,2-dihydrophenyl)acetyl-CoA isomerase [Alteribacillus persepolensis]